jgi:hypothetical protein
MIDRGQIRRSLTSATHAPAPKRHVDLWDLLVWAYRDQRVHQKLRNPVDWFLWALAHDTDLPDQARPIVHQDAAAVHAAVCALSQWDAELVVFHAAYAETPEPPTGEPKPLHLTADRKRDDYGWFEDRDGFRVDYLIREELHTTTVPVYRRRGRKMVAAGTEVITDRAPYCPIRWEPDPVWVEMQAGTYVAWRLAMARALHELRQLHLKDHALTGWDRSALPPMPDTAEEVDHGDSERAVPRGPEVTLLPVDPTKAVCIDGQRLYHRRACAKVVDIRDVP